MALNKNDESNKNSSITFKLSQISYNQTFILLTVSNYKRDNIVCHNWGRTLIYNQSAKILSFKTFYNLFFLSYFKIFAGGYYFLGVISLGSMEVHFL